MPRVTVLMPVYNSEKFLSEAIESILQQSFHDFEFIIIDDGSTDRSIALIKSYKDTRIRFYKNEKNLGISATLNKGIGLATGSYIARMDADDRSYPDRLKKQYEYMQANPDCAMVSSLVKVIGEDGRLIRQDKIRSEHFYYNLTFICWIYHPTVMYKKEAVVEVNSYTAAYSEDFELFWQLSRKFKFYNLPEVLLDYRVTKQSLHQVLKKQEYEKAQQEQVLRNLRYFTGDAYNIPESYIECFRHNFQPLLTEKRLDTFVSCVKELDYITNCILQKDNINYNANAIKQAAYYKRTYILSELSQQLPFLKRLILEFRLLTPQVMLRSLKLYLKNKILKSSSSFIFSLKPKM